MLGKSSQFTKDLSLKELKMFIMSINGNDHVVNNGSLLFARFYE